MSKTITANTIDRLVAMINCSLPKAITVRHCVLNYGRTIVIGAFRNSDESEPPFFVKEFGWVDRTETSDGRSGPKFDKRAAAAIVETVKSLAAKS